ncbi:MAG TPA: PAC2 family protein [Planctomycetota bacterium]|nr:PAC2 family protein [Planctomycetota bacterium]
MTKKAEPNARNGATLVAVWPGMGSVASTAGYYLMARLRMHETDPVPARDLFDPEHVEIRDGLVRPGTPPQGRLFLWKNPKDRRDVLVYLGDAQPPSGKIAFCDRLLDYATKLGVRDVFTFAALATDMPPTGPSRVLGVATDNAGLEILRKAKVELLKTGRISGLNGVFLAAVAERGLREIGLLGEIPGLAIQIAYPKASRRVLETFSSLSGIDVDLKELTQYEETVDRQLKEVMARLERTLAGEGTGGEEHPELPPAEETEPAVSESDRRRITELFEQARQDRSKSFELKRELDRLGLFKEYEDRFLDLFREGG